MDDYDCILILTDHDEFKKIDFSEFSGAIIDTRNFIDPSEVSCKYVGLGKGGGVANV